MQYEKIFVMNDKFHTGEDRMIYRLTVHKNMITWLLSKLETEGITARRTMGNDSHGDIELLNPSDVLRVQQLIREIQAEQNS